MNEIPVDPNAILNARILRAPPAPRAEWFLGTVEGTPAAGVAPVIIDGDTAPSSCAEAVVCSDGDRVVALRIGRALIVTNNLTSPAGAGGSMTAAEILTAIKTVDGAGSGLDADILDGHHLSDLWSKVPNTINADASLVITDAGELKTFTNTTGSTGFPTAYGQAWLFTGSTYGRDFIIWCSSTGAMYLGFVNATRNGVSAWHKLWHEGSDGSGSGLDADTLDGSHASAFATATQGTKADAALPASSYTAADVLAKVKTVDGSGSGLDADLLDGVHASALADFTAEAAWSPTFSCNGSMTISSVSVERANHRHLGGLVYIDLAFSCTLGGTASNGVRFTLPHSVAAGYDVNLQGDYLVTNHYVTNCVMVSGSTTTVQVLRVDSTTNYALGSGRYFTISGWYKPA